MTKLHEFKVELNPNQYGYAEQAAVAKPVVGDMLIRDWPNGSKPKTKQHPLDHDDNGRKGGSLPKAKRGGRK